MKKGIFLFIVSSIILSVLIGAGITLWGNENIRNQEILAAEELQARKDVVEVNSQMGDDKTFTVSTLGKEYRIIRFTADKDPTVLDQLTENILRDKELLRLLKKVGFREIQISSDDQSKILYFDLVNYKIGKKSNI